MPILKDAEQEMFCKLKAKNINNSTAYRMARNNDRIKNPSRDAANWLKRKDIQDRIAELIQEGIEVTTTILDRAEIDKQYVVKNLKDIVDRCMQVTPVRDMWGKPVVIVTENGEFAALCKFDAKNAIAALHHLGLEIGMFKEVKDLNVNVKRIEDMNPAERAAYAKLLDEQIARYDADAGGAQAPGRLLEGARQEEPARAEGGTASPEKGH